MCIIVTKEKNFLLPPKDVLEECFSHNPDGAGFAWSAESEVYWKKGFETFDAFYAELQATFPDEAITKQNAIVLHFRIGTHGPKRGVTHTHPFPCDKATMQELCELTGTSNSVLFHNGVISSMTQATHDKVLVDGASADPSDSMILAHNFIKPLYSAYYAKAITAIDFINFMENLIGSSRVVLLELNGNLLHYGSWVKDKKYDGVQFSNSNYEKPTYLAPKAYKWNNDGWNHANDDFYANAVWDMDEAKIILPKKVKESAVKSFTTKPKVGVSLPFWGKRNASPHLKTDGFVMLTPFSRVSTLKGDSCITYLPEFDDILYYRTENVDMHLKNNHIGFLFTEKNGKYYSIGKYTWDDSEEYVNKKVVLL